VGARKWQTIAFCRGRAEQSYNGRRTTRNCIMPSPFPGMNPYLEHEDAWNDFHERFIPAAAEEIGRQVRPAYIVKIDQNVYVNELPEGERRLLGRLDVYLVEGSGKETADTTTSAAALAAPARAQLVTLTVTE